MRRDAPPESATSPRQQQPVRGSWRLMVDPVFGPYFAGKLISTAGIWVHNIVAAILAYELSGSAFVVGLVSVAQFGPQLLFAPLTGAWADRGDRLRQVVLGRLIAASGAGGLAIWLAIAGVDGMPGAWPVVAAAGVVGIGFVIGGPAMNALLPAMVRPGELATAVALNTVPFTIARAGGPAVGALIAATAGHATAFGIAAVTNLVFAIMLWPLPVRSRAERGATTDGRIRAGLGHLRGDRVSLLLLVGVASIGIGADPVITLTPPLSAAFGRGATLVGVFASSFGVGAGIALVLLSSMRRVLGLERVAVGGLLALAVGMAVAGSAPTPAVAITAFGIGGAGMTMALTSLSTLLQERIPDGLRGRIMALWAVAFLGSRPIAAATNGAVSDATSPTVAFLMVSALVATAAWVCRPSRLSDP